MTETTLLEVAGLSKSYETVVALDDFSFALKKGEIFGLLGPNGAGKTTLISILSGILKDFFGSVHFKGKNLFADRNLRRMIGVVPQEMAFYEELNARENLVFFGRLYGLGGRRQKERCDELLQLMELDGRAKEPVKNFSGGMKRRLNLAIGMLHDPELLLMDEPTVGIDVQAKVRILEIIRDVGKRGTAVIFTTHQLAEAENLCDRIAIMDHGRILASGTLKELIQIVGEKEIVTIEGTFSAETVQELLKTESSCHILVIKENHLELALASSEKIPPLIEILFKHRIPIVDIKIQTPNLETVFLKFTGRSLRD